MSVSKNERVQILVSGEQKKRMRSLAERSNCSVSEIYRRAADAYTVGDDDQEINSPELVALVEATDAMAKAASAGPSVDDASARWFYCVCRHSRHGRWQPRSNLCNRFGALNVFVLSKLSATFGATVFFLDLRWSQ